MLDGLTYDYWWRCARAQTKVIYSIPSQLSHTPGTNSAGLEDLGLTRRKYESGEFYLEQVHNKHPKRWEAYNNAKSFIMEIGTTAAYHKEHKRSLSPQEAPRPVVKRIKVTRVMKMAT